jgi:hypothetical protein
LALRAKNRVRFTDADVENDDADDDADDDKNRHLSFSPPRYYYLLLCSEILPRASLEILKYLLPLINIEVIIVFRIPKNSPSYLIWSIFTKEREEAKQKAEKKKSVDKQVHLDVSGVRGTIQLFFRHRFQLPRKTYFSTNFQ